MPQSPTGQVLSPALIEKLRRSGIRLDREGRFWHEGEEIRHAGLRRALLRWMDRLDDGRPILRLDEHRYAYVDVEDTPLLAVSARWDGDRVLLTLNDRSEEELAYASLRVGEGDALYCMVRGGRLEARLTTAAQQVVAERIAEGEGGVFALAAAGERWEIGARPGKGMGRGMGTEPAP